MNNKYYVPGHCVKYLPYIISFNLKSLVYVASNFYPYQRWETSEERLSNSSVVSELVSSGVSIWTQISFWVLVPLLLKFVSNWTVEPIKLPLYSLFSCPPQSCLNLISIPMVYLLWFISHCIKIVFEFYSRPLTLYLA